MQDAGKGASPAARDGQQTGPVLQIQDDAFVDYRWKEGRWDLDLFKNPQTQQMDWKAWDLVGPTPHALAKAACTRPCMAPARLHT